MREAYRKHKNMLYERLEGTSKTIAIALVYTGQDAIPYAELEEKIILSLQRLADMYGVDTE